MLSHRNMVTGAESVAQYLDNTADDRLLAVLPFSFDSGFSQLSTAFHAGAQRRAAELPVAARRDHAARRASASPGSPACRRCGSSSRDLRWPDEVARHLRYITNSGGAMPRATLRKLRAALPEDDSRS